VAQLGARFHGMEEVVGSNPTRSTKTFQTLTANDPVRTSSLESKKGIPRTSVVYRGRQVPMQLSPRHLVRIFVPEFSGPLFSL
jgi:hypothetical protein